MRVPGGASSVIFGYRPASVRLAALISELAPATLLVFGIRHRRAALRLDRHAAR